MQSTATPRARKWLIRFAVAVAVLFGLVLVAGGAGPWLLGLLGVWAAMFAIAWAIGKYTGARAHYLETWPFEPDETVAWRDDRADIYLLPTMARPAIDRPLRLHRYRVVVTTRRILVATRELFTGKQRITYVLYVGAAPGSEDTGTFGGELKTGYRTLVVQRGSLEVRVGTPKQPSPCVALKPEPSVLSSFNCAEFRIYTDLHATFHLPAPTPSTGQA